jgi:hypothetical protein
LPFQNASLFHDHVTLHHFEADCPHCGDVFDLKNYLQHLSAHSNHRNTKMLKPTILQPRNSNNSTSSPKPALIKPKSLELLLGYGVSDSYEILLDGKLVKLPSFKSFKIVSIGVFQFILFRFYHLQKAAFQSKIRIVSHVAANYIMPDSILFNKVKKTSVLKKLKEQILV